MKRQRTKIIATITDKFSDKKLIQLYENGVSVLRINFSHATPETAKDLIERINKLNKKWETHLAILLDTKGPDIRTGEREIPLAVEKNQIFKIGINKETLNSETDIFCDYQHLIKDVSVGQEIIIDSGLLKVHVVEVHDDHIFVQADNDAEITSKRHINLPGVKIALPALINKDKEDIIFGIKMGVHFVAASFIRTGQNVKDVRKFLDQHGGEQIKIISKIENQEAIENLTDIVKLSDGVMVARGDLGIEIPIHTLPSQQKHIMDECFHYGKPVVVATELLNSMITNAFPTRAEVSDVYNSVIMRADAVMLSGETAIGKYPITSVKTMKSILLEAEKATNNKHKDFDMQTTEKAEVLKKAIARQALLLADEIGAKLVIAFSYTGQLAKRLSSLKPNQEIISFTVDEANHYKYDTSYGVFSEKIDKREKHSTDNQRKAISLLKEKNMLKKDDYVVVIWEKLYDGVHQPQIRVVPITE